MIYRGLNLSKALAYFNLIFILAVFVMGFKKGAFNSEDPDFAKQKGQSVVIAGAVCEVADVGISNRRLTVCGPEKVLVTSDLYPPYDYGDSLKISGKLLPPPQLDNFDYEAYLARYDIYALMYYPRIELSSSSLSVSEHLYKASLQAKDRVKRAIDLNLPEPEAGLAAAMLLGYRRTITKADATMFSRVGLSHMIAISGSHITIISAMIMATALFLGLTRPRALYFVYAFLIIYPLISGLAASAVRSAIMGGLTFLALSSGRLNSSGRALVFAAAVMLAVNPSLLRDDLGFQLSFAALLGITYFYPLAEQSINSLLLKTGINLKLKRPLKMIFDLLVLTMIAQLAILPPALISFRELSLVAPVANVLVLWIFPFLLASLILGILASLVWPGLGLVWFYPAHMFLKYFFAVTRILASPEWVVMDISWFNWYYGAVYYSLLVILFNILKPKTLSARRGFKK